MTYNENDIKSVFYPAFRINPSVSFTTVKTKLMEEIQKRNIPVKTESTYLLSGGFFSSSKTELFVIEHPTEKYAKIGIYMIDNCIMFPQLGLGEQVMRQRMREFGPRGPLGISLSAKPDMIKLQKEQLWQNEIYNCIDYVFVK